MLQAIVMFWVIGVQFVGVVIPMVGVFVLLNKEQSKAATNLMIANIGCLVMNASYFLMMRSGGSPEAILSLKIEYMGNVLFYFFFAHFLLAYLQLDRKRIIKWISYVWLACDCFTMLVLWDDDRRGILFDHLDFKHEGDFNFYYLEMDNGVIFTIRYALLSIILVMLVVYMVIRRLSQPDNYRTCSGKIIDGAAF